LNISVAASATTTAFHSAALPHHLGHVLVDGFGQLLKLLFAQLAVFVFVELCEELIGVWHLPMSLAATFLTAFRLVTVSALFAAALA